MRCKNENENENRCFDAMLASDGNNACSYHHRSKHNLVAVRQVLSLIHFSLAISRLAAGTVLRTNKAQIRACFHAQRCRTADSLVRCLPNRLRLRLSYLRKIGFHSTLPLAPKLHSLRDRTSTFHLGAVAPILDALKECGHVASQSVLNPRCRVPEC